ncbi:MAG: methyltransferase [Muribaculaceae bacterium]|nr:methyltransferase [Muribaculaceae bacterium]
MSKNIAKFRFKQFSVSHHRSSMKVGVDGVLIGCWTQIDGVSRILDVGTGCGLIALIMAQRCPEAEVIGIDIDGASVDEAKENIENSPWSDRVDIVECDFPVGMSTGKENGFDLIVSNPPYFDSGVSEIVTSRERARHQGSLSPSSLLEASRLLLRQEGMVAMVVPYELSSALEEKASGLGYRLMRKCLVRGHADAPYKRTLLQWRLGNELFSHSDPGIEYLTLEVSNGMPTEDYQKLCRDFYLKF